MEALLQEAGECIKPELPAITDEFYRQLLTIPQAAAFVEGRVDALKSAHLRWLNILFSGPYDREYVEYMHKIGDIHVNVNLPSEFMTGAMTLINNRLIGLAVRHLGSDLEKLAAVLEAISAVTGLSLLVMQQSYHESSVAVELDKFLKISGISRTLFTNLALAYKDK